jgi:hypothetical protein
VQNWRLRPAPVPDKAPPRPSSLRGRLANSRFRWPPWPRLDHVGVGIPGICVPDSSSDGSGDWFLTVMLASGSTATTVLFFFPRRR